MKVAVIGANGQLGSDLCCVYKEVGYDVTEFNHDVIDVVDIHLCREKLSQIQAEVVFNTAAMHNVELCEEQPAKAFEVNGIGCRNLAILSNELYFKLVHISTDYVFGGEKNSPYIEADTPSPLNVYANTKLSGEYFIRAIARRFFIARVSALYGHSPCRAKAGLNFIKLMLKLAKEKGQVRVVDDEIVAPTYTIDVAKQLEKLVATDNYGLYHTVSQGGCSWYEFAAKIFELTDTKVELSIVSGNEFPGKASRPKYTVLENDKLKSIGLDIMPHWTDALKGYLQAV